MNIRLLFVLLLSSLFLYGCPSMGPVSDVQSPPVEPVGVIGEATSVFEPSLKAPPELLQQLGSLIRYPVASIEAGEEGQVIVQAKVLKEGRTAEVKVVQSSSYPALDAEAVRVTKLVRFKPAVDDSDKAVNSWVRIPFRFKLED